MGAGLVLLMRDGCRILETRHEEFAVTTPNRRTKIEGLPPSVRSALLRLHGTGVAEEELVDAAGDARNLPLLFFALDELGRLGALSYRAQSTRGPLATASSPAPFTLYASTVEPETRYALSRFAMLRRVGNQMVIETVRSALQIVIDDARAIAFVAALAVPPGLNGCAATSGLSESEGAALGSLLLGCGVLADETESGSALAWWPFHDLLFHARSRFGRHHGRYGGTYPLRDRFEQLPAAKPAMSEDFVDLYRPDINGLRATDRSFTSVIEDRRSWRSFGNPPVTLRQIGEFLYRAARARGAAEQAGARPYPGGGAVYELEIYLCVQSCLDLPAGLYHYAPAEHRLYRLPASAGITTAVMRDATQSGFDSPQVLLTIAARFGRIFWKYESMAYALILKDLGALFQTMYLVAEAMGLGACAIGGGDSDLFANAAGLDYYIETSVGEFVIGSRAL